MRLIFTSLLACISLSLTAQLKQGDWNINTSTNAPMNLRVRSNGPAYRYYDFGVNPNAGYFIKDRWEIGGGPRFSFSGTRYKDSGPANYSFRNRNNEIGLSLYSRYYFKSPGRWVPYLVASGSYSRGYGSSTDLNNIKSSFRYNAWQVNGGAGLSWFLTSKAALFSELTYSGEWGSGMGYTHGLNLNIGIQFFLSREKQRKNP